MMRVLIVDQEAAHRQHLAAIVQKWGHDVAEVLTGREAVVLCRKKCPDLILVDAALSAESGVEIVRQIRQTGGHAAWAPIVLMGQQAALSESELVKCAEAGADDVLLKPISDGQLMLKVHAAQRQANLKEDAFNVAHELVVANRTLQNVVTQDLLTGLYNSSSFEDALEKKWFMAKKSQTPISLILLNLDFFSAFNQTYGAKVGDEALKQVANALKAALSGYGTSVLARMTGETFAILLPETDRQSAFQIGETLNKAIDALNITHKQSGCSDHLTASFGVATMGPHTFTKPWDLKDAADFGLYEAKHRGRHRGFLAPEETGTERENAAQR